MKIFDKNNIEILDIDVDDNSVRYRSIMNDDSLTLYFSTTAPVVVPRGAYCEFEGARYTLFYPENFKKNNTRDFSYTLTLHGWREALKLFKYKDLSAKPYRLKFPLTANPLTFLQLLVDCMNLHDSGWAVGSCIDTDEKLISFNHESCFDALGRIAEEFSTEWEISGKMISLGKVEKFKDNPLPLSYGMGNGFKSGIARQNDGDKQPVGRLYVEGGDRNIDYSTYGSKTLLLPKSATLEYDGKTYRTDADGMYVTRDGNDNDAEDSFDGTNHYPKRVGTVSSVIVADAANNFYDIIDSSIPEALNFRDCRIAGEKATIVFQSGALAGREFDIEQTDSDLTGYIHAERKFKLVPAELDGYVMPGGTFIPAVGDKYAIFNIRLPQAYISDDATKEGASWDMFRESVKYFAENEQDKFQFTGELDGIWSKSRWLEIGGKIVPGGHVLFSDPQFQPTGVVIRITAVKDYVNTPHKPVITLSNASVSGSFGSTLGKLEAEEVLRATDKSEVIRFTKRQYRDAKETIDMLQNAMLDFDAGISPITVQTMAILLGDKNLQFSFRNNQTIVWNKTTKQLECSNGDMKPLTQITTISPTHADAEYGQYNVPAYTSPPLTEKNKAYYLYVRVMGGMATFILDETAHKYQEPGILWFLVGILNSEQEDGERSFVRLHGITEILPGRINTDKIVSTDGKTYFDLANNIIVGRIKFLSADGTEKELTEGLDGRSPYIGTNGNWYIWNDSTQQYVDSGDSAQGESGDSGLAPRINASGYWEVWNGSQWVNTGVKAEGEDGQDAHSPYIGPNGNWYIWNDATQQYVDSGDPAQGESGENGLAPRINEAGYWEVWNGSQWVNTGVKARGEDGGIDAETLAKINNSKAITDKFGTDINGGLVTTVKVSLREADKQTETAGIVGIQGTGKNLPAFFAGGTYADAIAGTAKTIDNHDGSGHRAGGKLKWDAAGNVIYSGLVMDSFEQDPWYYLTADGKYYIDLERSNNVLITSLPNGSNNGWFLTYLPNEQKYSGMILNILWKPLATGFHWRIIRQGSGNIILTDSGFDYKLDLTSDSNRYVQLVAFWESNTLKWLVTQNVKIAQSYEDRVKAGDILLQATTTAAGPISRQSSKFGFTCACQQTAVGTYTVTVAKSTYNPLTASNYTPMVCGFGGIYFAAVKSISGNSFVVHTADDDTANNSAFNIILVANADMDLRNQYLT